MLVVNSYVPWSVLTVSPRHDESLRDIGGDGSENPVVWGKLMEENNQNYHQNFNQNLIRYFFEKMNK